MSSPQPYSDSSLTAAAHFATTHWTVVLSARQTESPRADDALSTLCKAYWRPIYAFVRRSGHSAQDSEDLTQEFFARLLTKHYLDQVDPKKGRFRSFLLAAVKHFLANEWDRAQAMKRGEGQKILPLDVASMETTCCCEPSHDLTPDRYFEQRWAFALLETVLARLRQEYASGGKTELFDQLKETLTAGKSAAPYVQLAARLGLSEGAVKVAVHRLRHRYRELLRSEIANTVASPDEIDDEMRYLFSALSPNAL